MANRDRDAAAPDGAGNPAADIHDRIASQAQRLAAAKRFGLRNSEDFPEVKALLSAAKAATVQVLPKTFQFEGRTYWLSVRLAVELHVFASPGTGQPLVSAMDLGNELHGHRPVH